MESNKTYDIIDAMIERYIANHNDHEAVAYLKKAATESEESCIRIRKQLELWFSSGVVMNGEHYDSKRAYARFLSRTAAAKQSDVHSDGKVNLRLWKRIGVAAAVAVAVVLPWLGYKYAMMNTDVQLAQVCVSTPNGSKSLVTLPDGSKVWLNAGSSMKYSQGFGKTDRDVTISGEACFDVTRNEKLPFTVSTKSAKLKVLGTKFTFRAYPNEESITVDLMRGHVDLASNKTGMHVDMLPNERTTINTCTGLMAKRRIDASRADSWVRGELFFDEMPLSRIAQSLERAYGVKVTVAEGIRNKHFYGTFNTSTMNIDQVLATMSETQRMSFRRTGSGDYLIY